MGTLTAERKVEIDAPLARCYEIVADLESTPEWQESMVALEVLERDRQDRATLCEITSDAKVRKVKSQYRFDYHPPDRMTWDQEKGDLKSLTGEWKLEDLGEGRTRATYHLEADPGRVLGLLLRGPVEGKVKEFLTKDAVEGLKQKAESG
jgi:ribosome-associated toxin RatA of RatAB toxin-antitoxin module